MDKFNWQATESAPKNFPMQIISGTLYYHGKHNGLYVPDRSSIYGGWGRGISSHVVGEDLKLLPDRLVLSFFSYTENLFYRAEFELPHEKILSLYQAGYYSPVEEKRITYNRIVVGVAPGGAVSVWLAGINKTTEVFFGQAEKHEGQWTSITTNTTLTRDEYILRILNDALKTPEAIEALQKNGVPVGLWDSYRVRYDWQPVLSGMTLRDDRIGLIKYYNGEQDYLDYPLEKEIAGSTRAIPSYMSFVWEFAPGKGRLFELTFDETEIVAAFKKLGNNNQPLQLVLLMEKTDGQNMFSSSLRNDKESIKLKRTNIETYSTRDREVEAAR